MESLSADEVARYAALAGLTISDSELPEYVTLVGDVTGLLSAFESIRDGRPRADIAARDPGRRPTRAEDPLNAVIRLINVSNPLVEGSLTGVRVGVKDTIAVAGIPMTAASKILDGYVPSVDSVVVERLINAGAEIVATLNMDAFAWSSAGDSGDFGAILNPHDTGRSSAGSSGGSAAALSYDWIDVTLGADQAGSIRMPASWCGFLGLKPTHGLIPYTGVMSIDPTIDHVGPMAKSVNDMARVLDVIAGPDPRDARQGTFTKSSFIASVASAPTNFDGVRLVLVEEAFSPELGVTAGTADSVREAVTRMESLGAIVEVRSVPEHRLAAPIAFAFYCEGTLQSLETGGNGYGHEGLYSEDAEAFGGLYRAGIDHLPPSVKTVITVGAMLRAKYYGQYYAEAQNMRHILRDAYNDALAGADALVLPTMPCPAFAYESGLSIVDATRKGWSVLSNTPGADVTGHPALSIPAAEVDGLPVGVMLLGRHMEDARLLRIARTYERAFGWLPDAKAEG